MFRPANGFRATYHDLTLVVAADFDEWRVVLQGPGLCIVGGRQFSEAKAKAHAEACAGDYLREFKQQTETIQPLDWQPLSAGEWLNWRP